MGNPARSAGAAERGGKVELVGAAYRPRRRQQVGPVVLAAAAAGGIWLGIDSSSRKTPILVVLLPVALVLVAFLLYRLLDPRPVAEFEDSGVRFQTGLGFGGARTYGWEQVSKIGRVEPRVVSINKLWGMKAIPDWAERRQAQRSGAAFEVTTSDGRTHMVWSAGPDPRLDAFRRHGANESSSSEIATSNAVAAAPALRAELPPIVPDGSKQ